MTPAAFLASVIVPRAARLLQHDSPEARCLLLAIAGQESGWEHRLQEPVAHARGWWQCERDGAVLAVLTSDATRAAIGGVCDALTIPRGLDIVFEAIAWNDTLAYWIARLALVLDPHPLPAIGDSAAAWSTYSRVWRPGEPRLGTWAERYDASAALFSSRSPATT
jgi:hypothetical protein